MVSKILAIDPGNVQSAYLLLVDGTPADFGKVPNEELLSRVIGTEADALAIECMQSFGMAVGQEIFDTQLWAGRFIQAFGGAWVPVYRKEVKLHLCQSTRAKDPNIRQALVDRFGGKEAAIGRKKTPGPLFGISADIWSALAIAITCHDTKTAVTNA